MVQTVEILLDSSILIGYLYHFLGFHGEKAPRTLKENERIPEILTAHDPRELFDLFSQLTTNIPGVDEVLYFMESYNLLSNDAIILAHCKSAEMHFVASYDSDFVILCEREGIGLLDSLETF